MAHLPLIDAHLHLWNPEKLDYPWLRDVPGLDRPFLLEDYPTGSDLFTTRGMVFLQCECDPRQYWAETDWVLSMARTEPRLRGIVSWAPLEKGERASDEIAVLAEHQLIKGVRRIIQYEADPEFCLRPNFVAGVRVLGEFNLSFDICVSHLQLENTIKLVARCPAVRFVLDHIGKPDIRQGVVEPWKTHLRRLALLPNVWCKISGLVVEADREHWTDQQLRPYIDHVLECFGLDRVLFGSDWPVVLLAAELPRWVETLYRAVDGCSDVEKRKLFHDNAIEFYRLDGPQHG